MSDTVMLFTMQNGSHVLGKVSTDTYHNLVEHVDSVATVITPMMLHLSSDGHGQVQIGLMPYGYPIVQFDPGNDVPVEFYVHSFATVPVKPDARLEAIYIEATSKIQLAKTMPTGRPNLNVV